ncbi:MAG TPA: alpha/beta fold hydrolase, partial [Massilibacterium sp.]|nr:alpha/beta fold hydrolase [Massilibacterium sp.]
MRVKEPQPFTFEAGERAVLLLHGFTGHSADVRMLGRFLQKHGYTSHAPIYPGHGQTPTEILQTNPSMWWERVVSAYEYLRKLGYDKIAVAGLSLGGVFSLKLGYTVPITGIITMCAPMIEKTIEERMKPFLYYAPLVDGEDMTDPANWLEGDVVECVEPGCDLTVGKFYTV